MTVMELNDDGSFTGSFQDSDMGVRGEGYPKGTVYKSDFSGKFSQPEQLGQFVYSAQLEYLNLDGTPGDEYIEDGTRYIYIPKHTALTTPGPSCFIYRAAP